MTANRAKGRACLRGEDVPVAFDHGAWAYDRLIGMNPGYHTHLRLSACRLRIPNAGRGLRLLDVGCGTGASTAALLAAAPAADIVAVDASEAMLAVARSKPWPDTVRFVRAGIENLGAAGVHGPFDAILAAYLVRNLAEPDTQLGTLAGLLRPGATLAVHEYSVRDSLASRLAWHAVCWGVIIPAAWIVAKDVTLYRHLWRSVADFDGATLFRRRLREAGFTAVHSETMTGWQRGIVHTFLASAPPGRSAP